VIRFGHVATRTNGKGAFGRRKVADKKIGARFPALIGLVVGVVVLALLLYFSRGSLAAFQLGKEQASFWDIVVKFVGGLVAIVGAIVALSKTFEERAKANQAALIEAQKPFMTKRQEIYFQLVSATSLIGNKDPSDPVREEAISQFWWIFWGALPMVADHPVAVACDKFSEILDASYVMPEGCDDKHLLLRNASKELAIACRVSLGFVPYQ
jgi:hypothetical protein